jgi:nucleotide-binding universal stress UspA family protein
MTPTTPIAGTRTGGIVIPTDHHAVLVPLDGSAVSEHAIQPARWLARRIGAEVHTVVVGYIDDSGWYDSYLTTMERKWPEIVPHFVGDLDVASSIVHTARRLPGCLVCMGTHGRARSAALLGSTLTDVARGLGGPLVAIGPKATVLRHDERRVVACVDGSPTSEQILPLGAEWAVRLGAELDVVVVLEPMASFPTHAERHRPESLLDPTAYVTALARRADLDGVAGVSAHVAYDPLGPEQGLADHLRRRPAALVATTSHLRTRFDRALHGSTAARIIHAAPVPVLVQPVAEPTHPTDPADPTAHDQGGPHGPHHP